MGVEGGGNTGGVHTCRCDQLLRETEDDERKMRVVDRARVLAN